MSRRSPRFSSLDEWLRWQEGLHPSSIDLGLERVGRGAARLGCTAPAKTVITVAGTNGKGSCIAMLEGILTRAGYRVGCYTSPHLFRYNERVRLQGEAVADRRLCEAFARVDRARGLDTLTYFEFGTLAALDIMCSAQLDVALLEVGLGGRLDAVNILDPDAALLSSVGLDHLEWLGPDRESVGREKAGIFRAAKPAVCGDPDPPRSVWEQAEASDADLRVLGRDYRLELAGPRWHWQGENSSYRDLPLLPLSGAHQLANAASVLMVLEMLADRLPVTRAAIDSGLRHAQLPGRIQTIAGKVEQVLDVSHNAQAAQALAAAMAHVPPAGKTHAVIGMLRDKDVESFVRALGPQIDHWHAVGLKGARASPPQELAARIAAVVGADRVSCHGGAVQALAAVQRGAAAGDRVLVCGSFYTVAEWASLEPAFG
ncbi:MAG: bifunctional tetrahydrofolate synthase/dihydrofolate synthase [Gammaproteobacteria bacterium]|jgi:dihydrofolate synthase/folylpolyglutamate synthase